MGVCCLHSCSYCWRGFDDEGRELWGNAHIHHLDWVGDAAAAAAVFQFARCNHDQKGNNSD